MLTLVQRVFYGPQSQIALSHLNSDLELREKFVLYPLATLMLVMGIFPNLWLTIIQTGVTPASGPAKLSIAGAAPDFRNNMSADQPQATAGGKQ